MGEAKYFIIAFILFFDIFAVYMLGMIEVTEVYTESSISESPFNNVLIKTTSLGFGEWQPINFIKSFKTIWWVDAIIIVINILGIIAVWSIVVGG